MVNEFPDDGNSLAAANVLSRLHRKAGRPDAAKRYARLFQERSKGKLLSADALCHKIVADGLAGSDEAVLSSSELYRSQFPDGPCSEKIEQIEAAIAAKRAAEAKALAEAQAKAKEEAEQQGDDDDANAEEETYPDGAADPEADEQD